MKARFFAAAALAAVATLAHALDPIVGDDGSAARLIESTVTSIQTSSGPQWSGLVEFTDSGGHIVGRATWAVQGCNGGRRLTARITDAGKLWPGGQVQTWAIDGGRIFDGVAVAICAVGMGSAGPSTAPVVRPRSAPPSI